jgi:hypothetical protein
MQLQEAIGRDDFERLSAEAEAEAGSSPAAAAAAVSSSSRQAAGPSAEAAAGFSQEDLDEDSGFFDLSEGADASAAAGNKGQEGSGLKPQVEWTRHDPNTFFAVDEDEVEEADSVWYSRGGPFDDLFGETGDNWVQQRRQLQAGGKGKGKRRKPAQQQQQQQQQ